MKRTILTIAIISSLLIGCNETKHKNENTELVETTEAAHEKYGNDMAAMDNSWVNEINLDNGNKWDANKETTEGVHKMLSLVQTSEQKTLEDYQSLAKDLNEAKNYLVKECTMEGPSHDNLHVLLHPLIEKIEALGKVSTVNEGSVVTASIKENLNAYSKYFQ